MRKACRSCSNDAGSCVTCGKRYGFYELHTATRLPHWFLYIRRIYLLSFPLIEIWHLQNGLIWSQVWGSLYPHHAAGYSLSRKIHTHLVPRPIWKFLNGPGTHHAHKNTYDTHMTLYMSHMLHTYTTCIVYMQHVWNTRFYVSQISMHAIWNTLAYHVPPFTPCQALVGYFDIIFDVKGYSLSFSTSPQDTPTHWKQTVFHFKDPIPVHTGMHLSQSHTMLLCGEGEKRAVYTPLTTHAREPIIIGMRLYKQVCTLQLIRQCYVDW